MNVTSPLSHKSRFLLIPSTMSPQFHDVHKTYHMPRKQPSSSSSILKSALKNSSSALESGQSMPVPTLAPSTRH
eukprot:c35896_g1_i1 orf=161-382(+)